jgi:hypothetical protein
LVAALGEIGSEDEPIDGRRGIRRALDEIARLVLAFRVAAGLGKVTSVRFEEGGLGVLVAREPLEGLDRTFE